MKNECSFILYQTFVRLSTHISDHVHFCAHVILLQHQIVIRSVPLHILPESKLTKKNKSPPLGTIQIRKETESGLHEAVRNFNDIQRFPTEFDLQIRAVS